MDPGEINAVPSSDTDILQTSRPSRVKRERRSLPRHAVHSSAKIIFVRSGSVLPGQILDLTTSGCCIRTEAKFSVGIYTRVETEFSLQGMPFRLGGVIQSIHDPLTVGIRFLDVSQRKREQLDQLIAEIAQNP